MDLQILETTFFTYLYSDSCESNNSSSDDSVRKNYCKRLMTLYNNFINDPQYLLNTNETAVHMNCSNNCMIHLKRKKTLSVMIAGAKFSRFALAFTVEIDTTKLSLFSIVRSLPRGYVRKQILKYLLIELLDLCRRSVYEWQQDVYLVLLGVKTLQCCE